METHFMTQTQLPPLPEEDYKKAQRLAFLLAQSVMPQEQKEAWINLLPVMLPKQVDQLVGILEREHQSYVSSSKAFVSDLRTLESSLHRQISQLKQEEKTVIENYLHNKISEYTRQ